MFSRLQAPLSDADKCPSLERSVWVTSPRDHASNRQVACYAVWTSLATANGRVGVACPDIIVRYIKFLTKFENWFDLHVACLTSYEQC